METEKQDFYNLIINYESKDQATMLSNCYYNKIVLKCTYSENIENKIKKYLLLKKHSCTNSQFITTDLADLLIF